MTKCSTIRIKVHSLPLFYETYGFSRQILFNIPIPDLDFDDKTQKKELFDSWVSCRNVPESYEEEHNAIKIINHSVKLHQMMLQADKDKNCYVCFLSTVPEKGLDDLINTITSNISSYNVLVE